MFLSLPVRLFNEDWSKSKSMPVSLMVVWAWTWTKTDLFLHSQWIKSEARGHVDWDGNLFTTGVTLSHWTGRDLLLRRYSHFWDRKPPSSISYLDLSLPCAFSPPRMANPGISKKAHFISCQEIIHLYNYESTKGNLYSIWLQVKDAQESISPIHLFLWN